MKNFYLILSCCALFSLTAHSENFSGDDFNGAWESDGDNQKVQPVGWHALSCNASGGFGSMKGGTVTKGGDDTNAYPTMKYFRRECRVWEQNGLRHSGNTLIRKSVDICKHLLFHSRNRGFGCRRRCRIYGTSQ